MLTHLKQGVKIPEPLRKVRLNNIEPATFCKDVGPIAPCSSHTNATVLLQYLPGAPDFLPYPVKQEEEKKDKKDKKEIPIR